MPLVEIKDFNASTHNKPFFDQPIKTCQNVKRLWLYNRELIRLTASSKIL